MIPKSVEENGKRQLEKLDDVINREFSESSLNALLCNLVAEWEAEGKFLDNEHDTSFDRGVGQTYKKCASELRKTIGA